MSEEEDPPADPTSPADELPELPPSESPPAEPSITPLEVVIPLIRDLEKSQIQMQKWYLKQFTQMIRDHNQMLQTQLSYQQQLTEISRRCQILQDWMMSPVRMIPVQVLQDNTMNIDQLHDLISERPSDNDPWSVQLLELIDHSIAAHFPHFEFPHWDLLNPEIPPISPDIPSEIEGPDSIPTPDYTQRVPEEPQEEETPPSCPESFQKNVTGENNISPLAEVHPEDEDIPSPSPPPENWDNALPSQDVHYPAPEDIDSYQDQEDEIPPSASNLWSPAFVSAVLPEEKTSNVLEVPDRSPESKLPPKPRKKQTWQSVPSDQIEQSELPMMLEPAAKRNPRSRGRKPSQSPSDKPSSKKKKRDS